MVEFEVRGHDDYHTLNCRFFLYHQNFFLILSNPFYFYRLLVSFLSVINLVAHLLHIDLSQSIISIPIVTNPSNLIPINDNPLNYRWLFCVKILQIPHHHRTLLF